MANDNVSVIPEKPTDPTVVNVPAANQETKPSIPLAEAFPYISLGDSGIKMLHGFIYDEYNPELQAPHSFRVYEEMRKSDGTVRAALQAAKLPIRRAKWFVKQGTDDEQGIEIATFVEHALFDWMEDMSFGDLIRQALNMLDFGVMPFEKVYWEKQFEGKRYITFRKIAPRMPKSILRWELPDGTFGIQQIRQDGIQAMIPGDKLIIFVNERDGDNWLGTSALRAPYKHWFMKNTFYKIDAIAFERQGLGVPTMKMPVGYTQADLGKVVTSLKNLRASESAYMIEPAGYEFKYADMGARTVRDPEKSINHHDNKILMSFLAQFMELGSTKTGSGSHALSQDHSDLFLKGLEAVADTIKDTICRQAIKQLVDLNYSGIVAYPTLDYEGIDRVDLQAFGAAYAQMLTSGAITPQPQDEQYIRGVFGLPPRTVEDQDGDGIEDDGDKKPTPAPEPPAKVPAKKKAHEHSSTCKHKFSTGFELWRPLTMTEKKVSWEQIDAMMNKMQNDFTVSAKAMLTKAKDDFMDKIHSALTQGNSALVAALALDFEAQYKGLLKDSIKRAYEYGKNNVAAEIGVQPNPTPKEALESIDLTATAIAEKTVSDLTTRARLSAATHIKQETSVYKAAGSIDADLEDAINKSVSNTSAMVIGKGINDGRNDTMALHSDDIYALQRSEVLDERTCDFCLSMDGLVIDQSDTWASYDIFHSSCRGIWVAILKDEVGHENITITGVPNDLADLYGGETNQLTQPKKPILEPNSPAADFVKQRDLKNNQ